ncbi:hypothetical protein FACS1894202_12340 [Clostridia bacterium]|nr:hypothetical protein FACS1894202_12340 [Clostridia bacterium]
MAQTPTLTRVIRFDAIPLEKAQYTDEGYLVDNPIVTSCGIFEYHDPDGSIRRELRLPEHVFNENSLATYKGKPVILTHDAGRVTKDNVAEYIIGTILTEGQRSDNDVRAEIVIHDTDELKASRLKELSLGYDLVLDETPGEWEGRPYDAIQTEIVINHLAIVREARAGEQARLNIDSTQKNNLRKGANTMARKTTTKKAMNSDEMRKTVAAFEERRKRRLDEAEKEEEKKAEVAENSDTESEVAEEIKDNDDNPPTDNPSVEERVGIIKDRRDRRDADGDSDTLEAAKAAIAEQDEDIEQLIEIVEELQAKSDFAKDCDGENKDEDDDPDSGKGDKPMNADSVDAIVAERLKLGRVGDKLNIDGLETLKPLDAKRRIIKAVNPNLRLDGKSDHYVSVAFDVAMQEVNSRKTTDYQRGQMFNSDGRSNRTHSDGSATSARERMIDRMTNGGNE